MKKTIKRIALTITILLALFGATTGIALASGYITWNGTQDYQETLINLNLISERGRELKSERDELGNSNEQLQNVIKDKDNKIDSLEQDIEALEKRINDGQTTQDQLKQAEKDMRDVKNKSEQVLNEFN